MGNHYRTIKSKINGLETSDGAGVNLLRLIGTPQLEMLDPFLMLDAFHSDDPDDYIAGFPDHPHRGFETVTYLLAGKMKHRDNAGHEGILGSGGVQWMSAGKGIIHSEIPQQVDGLMSGFQLWINLPASHKFMDPRYQEFEADEIPVEPLANGGTIKVIAGATAAGTKGPVRQLVTEITYMDIQLPQGAEYELEIPQHLNGFIHSFSGSFEVIGDDGGGQQTNRGINLLGDGECLKLRGSEDDNRLILLAGEPINEPVARRGPFVLNTQKELTQAFIDYREGRF
ncbi:MAG: pirin family protein [Sedimenticola sp.]